nr:MAG TPA_asm: hypothetical protein [Caudoviricetes sp.]
MLRRNTAYLRPASIRPRAFCFEKAYWLLMGVYGEQFITACLPMQNEKAG